MTFFMNEVLLYTKITPCFVNSVKTFYYYHPDKLSNAVLHSLTDMQDLSYICSSILATYNI